jgi:uncharacterized protein YndB with AHSA1/START domain
MSTDRIEKQILLRAPLARVWRALSDSTEFGLWFGMRFTAPFTPGALMRGVIVPTVADPEVAKAQKQYEGTPFAHRHRIGLRSDPPRPPRQGLHPK